MEPKEIIAKRVAYELKDGNIVNLGIGIPTLVADYIADNVQVLLHSENGFIGLGPASGTVDKDLINAGGQPASIIPGGAVFDSVMSFAMIRGGHLDMTVLGALEVDEQGNLANWMVPGKLAPGMGGAMDLVVGAKKVIVAMEHTAKDGTPKIIKRCMLPLTGKAVVDMIITNLGVFDITEKGIVLREVAAGVSVEKVLANTAAEITVDSNLKEMPIV